MWEEGGGGQIDLLVILAVPVDVHRVADVFLALGVAGRSGGAPQAVAAAFGGARQGRAGQGSAGQCRPCRAGQGSAGHGGG